MNSKNLKIKSIQLDDGNKVYYAEQLDTAIGICTYEDKFLLIRHYRPIFKKYFLEFPGGSIEKNENENQAAIREIFEEIGIKVTQGKKVVSFASSIGTLNEIIHVFHFKLNSKPIVHSNFEILLLTSEEIENLLGKDEIVDGKTLLGYLQFKHGTQQ